MAAGWIERRKRWTDEEVLTLVRESKEKGGYEVRLVTVNLSPAGG